MLFPLFAKCLYLLLNCKDCQSNQNSEILTTAKNFIESFKSNFLDYYQDELLELLKITSPSHVYICFFNVNNS